MGTMVLDGCSGTTRCLLATGLLRYQMEGACCVVHGIQLFVKSVLIITKHVTTEINHRYRCVLSGHVHSKCDGLPAYFRLV